MNIEKLIRENVRKMKPYSSARDEFSLEAEVFIDANENPFETTVNRYPDPHQNLLKEELTKVKKVRKEQLLLGNGSDEVLDLIFRSFCEPYQDNIIYTPPTYGMYKVLAQTNAVEGKEAFLNIDFSLNIENIENQLTEATKIVFLCSPNNPTGNILDANKIEYLLNKKQFLVVIDEAYIDFSEAKSWVDRLDEFENLIVTQTFSKAYGLAGVRLGICFSSELIMNTLKKIKPPYNVNSLTQKVALERLKNKKEVEVEIALLISERSILKNELKNISFIEKVYESEANFVLTKVDDATKRYQQLLEKGIVARNRTTQVHCENTLRFSIGTALENQKLIEVLKEL